MPNAEQYGPWAAARGPTDPPWARTSLTLLAIGLFAALNIAILLAVVRSSLNQEPIVTATLFTTIVVVTGAISIVSLHLGGKGRPARRGLHPSAPLTIKEPTIHIRVPPQRSLAPLSTLGQGSAGTSRRRSSDPLIQVLLRYTPYEHRYSKSHARSVLLTDIPLRASDAWTVAGAEVCSVIDGLYNSLGPPPGNQVGSARQDADNEQS
jgi:hypothetical protein